jgi:glycosyltransferase involved in cell wall biosynthesis
VGGSQPGALVEDALLASVIVPTRNSGPHLRRLLEALSQQTLSRQNFEVILGDDGSTDGSTEGLATADGWLRITKGPPLTSYAARNRAAAIARSKTLAFCDADCMPEPDWLEAGLAALRHSDVAAGAIHFTRPKRVTPWTLVDIDWFLNQQRMVNRGGCTGCNLFVRKTSFDVLGGFDESLPSGGDHDFALRCAAAGLSLHYAPDARVRHETRNSLRELLQKTIRVSYSAGARLFREGGRPTPLTRFYIPIVGVALSRARSGRSLRVDRERLALAGITPRLWTEVPALIFIYGVVPYLGFVARFRGWSAERRNQSAKRLAANPASSG